MQQTHLLGGNSGETRRTTSVVHRTGRGKGRWLIRSLTRDPRGVSLPEGHRCPDAVVPGIIVSRPSCRKRFVFGELM